LAWLNAMTAYEQAGLTSQLLDQAKLAQDLAQSRYDPGLSSIIELSQAQLNFIPRRLPTRAQSSITSRSARSWRTRSASCAKV